MDFILEKNKAIEAYKNAYENITGEELTDEQELDLSDALDEHEDCMETIEEFMFSISEYSDDVELVCECCEDIVFSLSY